MSRLIKIYTDGSSIGNPGPGGYGIVMLIDKEDYKKEFSQGFKLTTNNRMELLAVIIALEKIKIKNSNVNVYTDSKYVFKTKLDIPKKADGTLDPKLQERYSTKITGTGSSLDGQYTTAEVARALANN